jgi:chemotaxis methyl-accepting protein methylase
MQVNLQPAGRIENRMDDREFKHLLHELGYDFEGYRRVRKGVKKRVRRHMRRLGCRDVAAYIERIAASAEDRQACRRRMAVPISRFMRDAPFWDALKDAWLPELRRQFGAPLHAWSAGCACGEEAYSLAIIDREYRLGQRADAPAAGIRITASDLNPECLDRARMGAYPASSLKEMPQDLITRYFTPIRGGRRYRIDPDLAAGIIWNGVDIEEERPAPSFHLILLRNSLLTYRDPQHHNRLLANVTRRLHSGGLLVVGSRETLPQTPDLVPVADSFPFVGRKSHAAAS